MGNVQRSLRGDDPSHHFFRQEFQGELELSECLLIYTKNNVDFYWVNDWGIGAPTFPLDQSLSDTFCELKIDPAAGVKAVQLSGNLYKLVANNAIALESLLEDIASLPDLIRLRIVLPMSGGKNIGRFISILRKTMRQVGPKEVEVDGECAVRFNGGEFDIVIRMEEVDYDDNINNRTERIMNPLILESLQFPTLQEFELKQTEDLHADTFQAIFNTGTIQKLTLSGIDMDQFEVSTIVNALNTQITAKTNKNGSNRRQKKKRKRGQALGTLYQLKELEINQISINMDLFQLLFRGLESNATIESFTLEESIVNATLLDNSSQEEFWNPILSLVRHNNTIQELEILDVQDNRGIYVSKEQPATLSSKLEEILRNHNHSLTKIDLGSIGMEHSDGIWELLLLNTYKLRPLVDSSRNDSHHDGYYITKQQFCQILVGARDIASERENDEECFVEDLGAEFLSILFFVFRENPLLLVNFVADEMQS